MNPDKPKTKLPTREAAEVFRQKLLDRGYSPALLDAYRCKYAPKGQPHYHVGHVSGDLQNYGRMPARNRSGRKRRHAR
jgi:DNA primase